MQIKSISRLLLALFFLLLTGYSRLDIHLLQNDSAHNLTGCIENIPDYSIAAKINHTKIKPATKGKKRKRGKAIILTSETQEENEDEENSDGKQNTLQKYVKHVSIPGIFLSSQFNSFQDYSKNYLFPSEPVAPPSDKNILFQIFRI